MANVAILIGNSHYRLTSPVDLLQSRLACDEGASCGNGEVFGHTHY